MVYLEPAHSVQKRSFTQRFRPFFYYDASIDSLTTEKIYRIKHEIIPVVRDYFSNLLIVKPTMSPIRLDRDCNGNNDYFPLNSTTHKACELGCDAKTFVCLSNNSFAIPT
ncbi:hypothetical protein, partial [Salmonella sp. s51228]|uniref:hypothetical protein n=1 Tax=Salmonella sp. s51228 TaxID=3159652 RepID=UPI003980BF18